MKRLLKSLAIFSTLLLLAFIVFFPLSVFEPRIAKLLRDETTRSGTQLDFDSLQLRRPLSMDLKNVRFVLPLDVSGLGISVMGMPMRNFPLELHLNSMQGNLHLLPLLLGGMSSSFAIDGYGGEISGNCDRTSVPSIFGNTSCTIDAKNLKLDLHPIIRGVGLTGTLNLKLSPIENLNQTEGTIGQQLDLTLNDATFQGGKFSLLTVPKIDNASLQLSIKQPNDKKWILEKFDFGSSLGHMTADGSGGIAAGKISGASVKAKIGLTPEGAQAFGPWLSLAANLQPDAQRKNWTVTVSQEGARQPKLRVIPD